MKPRRFLPSDSWLSVFDWLRIRGKSAWSVAGNYYVRDVKTKRTTKMKRGKFVRLVDSMRLEEGLQPFLRDSKRASKSACQPE